MRNVAYILPSLSNKATVSSYVILGRLVLCSLTHIIPCLLVSGSEVGDSEAGERRRGGEGGEMGGV